MRKSQNLVTLAILALAIAALGWAYGPLSYDFTANVWSYKPHYQHFPFVVLASLLLMARELGSPTPGNRPSPYWAPAGFGLAWLLLIPAYMINSPLLAVISLILLIGAIVCVVVRVAGQRFPLGSWALLWLIVPPPSQIDGLAIQALQRQSSALGSYALDTFGVFHVMDGNALTLLDRTLFVDEACSGIVSAVSIVACAAMYCVWRRRRFSHTLLVMGLAAVWAMLLNVCRIVAIALAHEWAGVDLVEGIAHTGVGLAAFGIGLLTLVASDWFATAMLAEIGPRWDVLTAEPVGLGQGQAFGQGLVDLWDAATRQSADPVGVTPPGLVMVSQLKLLTANPIPAILIASFAAVGCLNLVRQEDQAWVINFPETMQFVSALQAIEMPKEIDGLQRITDGEHKRRSAESLFAQHSVSWMYRDERQREYLISCDFPYVGGWHDLTACYRGNGWQLKTSEFVELEAEPGRRPYEFATIEFTRIGGDLLSVSYTAALLDGTAIEPPSQSLADMLQRSLFQRQGERRLSFQVQVYTHRKDVLTDMERDASSELLELALRSIIDSALPALASEPIDDAG